MMAGKNQAAIAVCAQTKVVFPFKIDILVLKDLNSHILKSLKGLC